MKHGKKRRSSTVISIPDSSQKKLSSKEKLKELIREGEAKYRCKDFNEAINKYYEAIQLFNDHQNLRPKYLAIINENMGNTYNKWDDLDQALTRYKTAFENNIEYSHISKAFGVAHKIIELEKRLIREQPAFKTLSSLDEMISKLTAKIIDEDVRLQALISYRNSPTSARHHNFLDSSNITSINKCIEGSFNQNDKEARSKEDPLINSLLNSMSGYHCNKFSTKVTLDCNYSHIQTALAQILNCDPNNVRLKVTIDTKDPKVINALSKLSIKNNQQSKIAM